MTRKVLNLIAENPLIVSAISTLVLLWLDIHCDWEPCYSLITIFYSLRNESDLGGLLGFFSLVIIYFGIVFYFYKFIIQNRFVLALIMFILLILFHLPFICIYAKVS